MFTRIIIHITFKIIHCIICVVLYLKLKFRESKSMQLSVSKAVKHVEIPVCNIRSTQILNRHNAIFLFFVMNDLITRSLRWRPFIERTKYMYRAWTDHLSPVWNSLPLYNYSSPVEPVLRWVSIVVI